MCDACSFATAETCLCYTEVGVNRQDEHNDAEEGENAKKGDEEEGAEGDEGEEGDEGDEGESDDDDDDDVFEDPKEEESDEEGENSPVKKSSYGRVIRRAPEQLPTPPRRPRKRGPGENKFNASPQRHCRGAPYWVINSDY